MNFSSQTVNNINMFFLEINDKTFGYLVEIIKILDNIEINNHQSVLILPFLCITNYLFKSLYYVKRALFLRCRSSDVVLV